MQTAATTIASAVATTATVEVQQHARRRSPGGRLLRPASSTSGFATAPKRERLALLQCGLETPATGGI